MNDKILAYVRTGYLLVVGSSLGWLADQGIDVPIEALDAVLWPLVTFIFYVASREITERVSSTKLAKILTGPGPAPIYNDIPDDVLEGFLAKEVAVQ